MTITHLSHFGLTILIETEDNILFAGSLANCRRMAFAHGLEIDRIEGQIVSYESGVCIKAPASESKPLWTIFKQGGFILKGTDSYTLVMPQRIWKNG